MAYLYKRTIFDIDELNETPSATYIGRITEALLRADSRRRRLNGIPGMLMIEIFLDRIIYFMERIAIFASHHYANKPTLYHFV